MVRIINIDTKNKTIRVSNEDKDIDWITVKGTHVPIKKGESKGEAVEKFFEDKGRKFYRGSVVHKDTIDGLKKAKDKHGETMKYWESEGKKNHKEKGYADFVKKEIEAQKQYAKRLDESIADISRDFEIDPEDIGMNKEFDDWKKSKQPAKKKETSQEELKIKRNRGEISDQEYARKSKQKISRDDVADKSAGTGEILDQMLMIGGITQQERYRMDKMMEHHDIKPDDLINVLESGEYSPEQVLYTVLGYDEEPVLHMLDLAKKK